MHGRLVTCVRESHAERRAERATERHAHREVCKDDVVACAVEIRRGHPQEWTRRAVGLRERYCY